jgi:hypothetical protein
MEEGGGGGDNGGHVCVCLLQLEREPLGHLGMSRGDGRGA